jgi:hypothetical protein
MIASFSGSNKSSLQCLSAIAQQITSFGTPHWILRFILNGIQLSMPSASSILSEAAFSDRPRANFSETLVNNKALAITALG